MHLTLICVGKLKAGPQKELAEMYLKRLHSGVRIVEIDEKRASSPARATSVILEAVPQGAHLILLDERGMNLSSRAFAEMLEGFQNNAVRDVAFVIGGADGHTQELRDRAARLISFGAATWPHQLVRVMVLEQLYRAQQIQSGHPYHRD